MTCTRLVQPAALALIACSPLIGAGSAAGARDGYGSPAEWPAPTWAAFAVAAAGQFLFWLSMGVEGPLEMGYRQAVTPDRLIARMSATMRSLNRGMIVLGAPVGGAAAILAGSSAALWLAAAVMLASALILLFSRFRRADVETDQLAEG